MKHFVWACVLLCGVIHPARSATVTLRTNGGWSVATNWTPSLVPGPADDAVVGGQRYVDLSANAGRIKTLTLGNATAEGAINVLAGGSLVVSNGSAVCVVLGGPGSAGTQFGPYPSYYSHQAGSFTTTGDLVVGTNALSGQAFFEKGAFTVGGTLKVGAQSAGTSEFKVRGGGSGVSSLTANRLEVGQRGKLVFDYLGGSDVLPITVTSNVVLATGSSLVVTNLAAVPEGTWTLINGAAISGTFGSVEFSGLPAANAAEIRYDSGSGEVLLVVSNVITEFDNFTGDFAWTNPDNWLPTYPGSVSVGRLLAAVNVDSEIEIGYLETGNASLNSALNLVPGGSLRLSRPGVSLVVGVASNSADVPNYYAHTAGSLSTVGDLVLGANGGRADAYFSSGDVEVGATLRVGSYQAAGPSVLHLRGGGGSISANQLEVGANGRLSFDFVGGVSLKTLTVGNGITLASGSRLAIANTSASPFSPVPATYTLLQGGYVTGTFSQVDLSAFPTNVTARIAYTGDAVQLVVENASAANPTPDPAVARLGGFSRVVPLGDAGYSYGVAADGEAFYFTDYNQGTISYRSNAITRVVYSNQVGIYGLARQGNKMYFSREGTNAATTKIFELTGSGAVWGGLREIASGIGRPRQLFVESSGTILVAAETAGSILRIDPVNGTVTTVVTNLNAPQAAVSDAAGNLYFNEYGTSSSTGVPVASGKLWKRPAGSGSRIQLLEGYRMRGLALVSGGTDLLAQLTEANTDDQGNSATLTVLNTSGGVVSQVQGIDYPQFTALSSSGAVLTTAPRDKTALGFLPENPAGSDAAFSIRTGVDVVATVRGSASRSPASGGHAVELTGLAGGTTRFYVVPDSNRRFAGWVRMNRAEWPSVSTDEVAYPDPATQTYTPGVFALPSPGVLASGTVDRVQVMAHRSRNISRWPMTNVGQGNEAPQAGFSEVPDGYLAYIEISQIAPLVSWDAGGGPDAAWSTAANWSGDVLPGPGNNVLVLGSAYVMGSAGPVGSVTIGNEIGNGALNMGSGGVLNAASLTIGAVNNAGGGTGYPNYFRSERNTAGGGGRIVTTGDFTIGANGAKVDGIYDYTSTGITVGGALKIGAGYTTTGSTLKLEGAGGDIRSGSLVIGGGVQLVLDFIGGNSMRTLTANNAVSLESGSKLKVVGSAGLAAGNNYRLIDGGANQFSGTFGTVTFEGFPASVIPRIEYNEGDGDVWLVLSPRMVSWDGGGGADAAWSTAANWSGNALPIAGDDVSLNGAAQVTGATGPVGNVVVGDAAGNGSLNMISPGSLAVKSLTIGAANNGGNFANYFYGNGGGVTTVNDFVLGANGAKIDATYTWGDISVGGALKIGSGYTASGSALVLRGASGAITSGSLSVGGGVQLVFDFIGGTAMRTLTAANAVVLEPGSSLKVVGNANIAAGNNPRLINGGANQLTGTFGTVTFEGFPATVAPRIEYNTADGDVWLVVDSASESTPPFNVWSGTTSPPDADTLPKYAVGGAAGPAAAGQPVATGISGSNFQLSAIVRTNDPGLTVTGQSALSLSGPWSDLAVDPQGTPSANTDGVSEGCQRRVFSVDRGTHSKRFLRLKILWQ